MSFRERAKTQLQALPRRLRRRLGSQEVQREDFVLESLVGYRIAGTLWRCEGARKAVVLTPGTDDPGSVFQGWSQPVNALEIASRGYVCVHFDPAGRGNSWGEEDYGGPEHQDDLRTVIEHVRPQVDQLGVLSISLGLAMAAGALTEDLGVDWLLDWEGPCDREIICAGGEIMVPAMGHGLDDDVYWHPREAVRHVGSMRCGYVRFQSGRDHAQPGELRHATRMIEAAAAGSLPFFHLNDHGAGVVPAQPEWYAPGRSAANRQLLSWIERLSSR